jgi:amino acid adenylation domain-containing protein
MAADETDRGALSPAQRARLEARLRGEGAAAAIPRRPPGAPIALSSPQRSLWLLDGVMDGLSNPSQIVLRLRGALDRSALDAALTALRSRHDALRTVFPTVAGAPQPAILPPAPLAAVEAPLPPSGIGAAIAREAQRRFDLARGPLLRAALSRIAEEEHLLVLTAHHIAVDGWSEGLLADELIATYDALAAGRPPPPHEPALDHADYAAWEQASRDGPRIAEGVAHFRAQLDGAPALLALPTDRARPARRRFEGAVYQRALPPDLLDRARNFARSHQSTLYATGLAALFALLERHTGQRDLVVGLPLANRDRVELEPLVGCLSNAAALRAEVRRDDTFATLHERVREALLGALAHQDAPIERVMESLRGADGGAPPLQLMFQLEDWRGEPRRGGGVVWERLRGVWWERAMHDLRLLLVEWGGGPRLFAVYDAALFEEATVARLAERLETLLDAALAAPEAPLADRAILPPAELALLERWAGRVAAERDDRCLHDLVRAQAERRPDAPALLGDVEALTFRELLELSARLAAGLRARGVGPESHVGLCARRTPRAVAAMLAIAEAGAAWVPLDPDHPPARLSWLARDASAKLVLTDALIEELIADSEHRSEPIRASDADRAAYLLYTSGSTGEPKGVLVTHRGAVNTLRDVIARLGLRSEDRVAALISFQFDVSLFEIFGALAAGAAVALIPSGGSDPAAIARTLVDRRCTVMTAVPSVVAALLDQGHEAALAAAPLRTLVLTGEAAPLPLVARLRALLPSVRLWNLGGPTECSIFSNAFEITAPDPAWRSVPYGHALSNQPLYVLDERRRRTPIGVAGELHIGGLGVCRGYHVRPELTAERLLPDPFGAPGGRMFRTGDRVRWRHDGELELLGRVDRMVKLRGLRVEVGEIEAALVAAGASEAAVAPREGRLVAWAAGAGLDAGVLRERLRATLPAHLVPARIVTLAALPRLPNGKVDPAALPAPAAVASDDPVRTADEALVATLWTELLRVEVGPRDDFVALGGDSLQATDAMRRLSAALGRDLPVGLLFDHPTPAALAAALRRAGGAAALPPLTRDAVDDGRLSFTEERFWLLEQLEERPAYHLYTLVPVPPGADVEGALAQLIARHPQLRATYPVHEGEPSRALLPPWRPAPATVEVANEAALPAHVERALAPRFDPARGPLVRFERLRFAEGEQALLCVVHHLVCDGLSLGLLERELTARFAGSEPAAPEVGYADFAAWQRRIADEPLLTSQRTAWAARLTPPPARLVLPRPRRRHTSDRAGVVAVRREWPADLSRRLRALWRAHGATPFAGLLATWCALLARYCGADDLLLGMPEAGRRQPGLEHTIGCFVNTLPLRVSLAGDPPVAEILARAAEAARFTFAHADVPFELLADALPRGDRRRPLDLYIVSIDLLDPPPGPRARPLPVEEISKADATLYVTARGGPVRIELVYDGALFDEDTMERHADDLERIAAASAADPSLRLSALPIGSGA